MSLHVLAAFYGELRKGRAETHEKSADLHDKCWWAL
jgi:hypothetical protein